jgi:hypothetical protein
VVHGLRKSVPLNLIRMSSPGVYAVPPIWAKEDGAKEGTWAIRIVVTNPDYGQYVTSALVPASGNFEASAIKQLYRAPTEGDIAAVLAQNRQ